MRIPFAVAALLACLAVGSAFAGEMLIGTIIVTDGGTATNRTTGWAAYTCPSNVTGGCFVIGAQNKITVQCDQASYVGTGVAGCDAGRCLKLAADEKFPTAMGANDTLTGYAYNSDAGPAGVAVTYYGTWLATSPAGTATSVCKVYSRSGNE